MIRSEFCLVVGMTVPTFNTHRRNGDLPFDLVTTVLDRSDGTSWARFSTYDAMLMIASRMLVSGQGVSWSEAARMLRETPIHVSAHSVTFRDRNPDQYFARVESLNPDGEVSDIYSRFNHYRGTLPDIVKSAYRAAEVVSDRAHFERDKISVATIASCNLSHAWQIAEKRVKDLGIDVANDGGFRADSLANVLPGEAAD